MNTEHFYSKVTCHFCGCRFWPPELHETVLLDPGVDQYGEYGEPEIYEEATPAWQQLFCSEPCLRFARQEGYAP